MTSTVTRADGTTVTIEHVDHARVLDEWDQYGVEVWTLDSGDLHNVIDVARERIGACMETIRAWERKTAAVEAERDEATGMLRGFISGGMKAARAEQDALARAETAEAERDAARRETLTVSADYWTARLIEQRDAALARAETAEACIAAIEALVDRALVDDKDGFIDDQYDAALPNFVDALRAVLDAREPHH